jgi:hypothetical protein
MATHDADQRLTDLRTTYDRQLEEVRGQLAAEKNRRK